MNLVQTPKSKRSKKLGNAKFLINWCNWKLSVKNLKINNIKEDFNNGLLLIQLAEIVSKKKCLLKYKEKPKNKRENTENCSNALSFLRSLGVIDTRNLAINSNDIVNGDEKKILELIQSIILKFELLRFSLSQKTTKFGTYNYLIPLESIQKKLLVWMRRKCQEYKITIDNFPSSFNDGLAYSALLASYFPESIDITKA
ncbi:spectrin beta chain [Anaeramoeba ignava]|uniref:Spectrin beta chain n=1 Tax=Anaeramoeba ignava TaxID=1746090 RepID=A0A9Q0R6I7_ANAIG|nr:spectrin beta chain [Anaeramoeba ignava]